MESRFVSIKHRHIRRISTSAPIFSLEILIPKSTKSCSTTHSQPSALSFKLQRLCEIQRPETAKDLPSSTLRVLRLPMLQWMPWTASICVIDRFPYRMHSRRTRKESVMDRRPKDYSLLRTLSVTAIDRISCLPTRQYLRWCRWTIIWCRRLFRHLLQRELWILIAVKAFQLKDFDFIYSAGHMPNPPMGQPSFPNIPPPPLQAPPPPMHPAPPLPPRFVWTQIRLSMILIKTCFTVLGLQASLRHLHNMASKSSACSIYKSLNKLCIQV